MSRTMHTMARLPSRGTRMIMAAIRLHTLLPMIPTFALPRSVVTSNLDFTVNQTVNSPTQLLLDSQLSL